MIEVVNQENKKVEELDLPERIFSIKWNPSLVQQVLSAYLANRRNLLAVARDRGMVRGGGKKPWRQKGTGRARHGSIRSPIWKGGGVTFGPTAERVFAKKINRKMKQLAIFSVLSQKLRDKELIIVDNFDMPVSKTKELNKVLKNLVDIRSSILIILSRGKKSFCRMANNLKKAELIGVDSLNIYDLLRAKNILLEKEAIKEMEDHYTKI